MDVSLVKGVVRYDDVLRSLRLIQVDIEAKLSSSRYIVIKPDLLHTNGCDNLSLTNIDAVKAVLDFIEENTNKKVTVAEGSFASEDVFHNHNYYDLLKDYSVKFVNLDADDFTAVNIGKSSVNISQTLLKSDFRISLAMLKRDRRLGFLGTIPNIVLGSISESGKGSFYHDKRVAKKTTEILKLLNPHLSVIDGFDSIKTEAKVKISTAVASKDAVAADTAAAMLLNLKPKYLSFLPKKTAKIIT